LVRKEFRGGFVNLCPAAGSGLAAAYFGGDGVLAFEVFVAEEVAADDECHQDGGDEHADDEEESKSLHRDS
jgi:hypothetical protein